MKTPPVQRHCSTPSVMSRRRPSIPSLALAGLSAEGANSAMKLAELMSQRRSSDRSSPRSPTKTLNLSDPPVVSPSKESTLFKRASGQIQGLVSPRQLSDEERSPIPSPTPIQVGASPSAYRRGSIGHQSEKDLIIRSEPVPLSEKEIEKQLNRKRNGEFNRFLTDHSNQYPLIVQTIQKKDAGKTLPVIASLLLKSQHTDFLILYFREAVQLKPIASALMEYLHRKAPHSEIILALKNLTQCDLKGQKRDGSVLRDSYSSVICCAYGTLLMQETLRQIRGVLEKQLKNQTTAELCLDREEIFKQLEESSAYFSAFEQSLQEAKVQKSLDHHCISFTAFIEGVLSSLYKLSLSAESKTLLEMRRLSIEDHLKTPQEGTPEIEKIMSGDLFLRIIIPYIVDIAIAPETDNPTKKILMSFIKILQNIANQQYFHPNDSVYSQFNPVIEKYIPLHQTFVRDATVSCNA